MNNGQNDCKNGPQGDREQNQNQGKTDWNEYYRARGFERQPATAGPNDPAGNSSLVLGIIALVALSFCQIASIVCGIIAVSRARDSRMFLRRETSSARAGRICGIIAIVLSVTVMIGMVLAALFALLLGFSFLYPFYAFFEYAT